MTEVTATDVRKCFDYNPFTGILTRKAHVNRSLRNHRPAGTLRKTGYLVVNIRGKTCLVHRIIWLWVHGHFPTEQIDHINHIRTDNRLANLRPASFLDNRRNLTLFKRNTSGVCGVGWEKSAQKWRSRIKVNYSSISLGYFENFDDAVSARKKAEKKYGFHPNHGL